MVLQYLTLIMILQAHRLVLAQTSRWFHRIFQSQKGVNDYHIAFFNYNEQIVQALIDVINGKEVVIPRKEKTRFVSLLEKLGVKWEEEVTPPSLERLSNLDQGSEKSAKNPLGPEPTPSVSKKILPQSILPSGSKDDVETVTGSEEPEVKKKDDLYALLDTFTETSEEELQRIQHRLFGESGQKTRRYKCTICGIESKYFTLAKKHHSEHEHERLKPIREKMKKAEMDRRSDEQDISKLEKAIGNTDKKKVVKALRQINENLEKHVEVLDSVEKTMLPRHLAEKCKEYTKNLLATIKKADMVITKLGY